MKHNAELAASLSDEVRRRAFIIIPAYNEATSLANVLQDVCPLYPNVVVVDDGSDDDTFKVAQQHGVMTLRHIINRGQGAALQTGIEFALSRGAEFIVTFDADGQHQASDIAALLQPIVQGQCEVTWGSRFLGSTIDMPKMRRIILRLARLFTRVVNRVQLTDSHNGLRAFSRHAAQQIHMTLDRMAYASEIVDIIHRNRLSFREVPVVIRYTAYSLGKGQTSRSALRVAFDYLISRIVGSS